MARLIGCGSHHVRILDRTGGTVAEGHTLVDVEWARTLDDVSTAKVTIVPDGPDCCGAMGKVRSWRHTMAIYRTGASNPVWLGPVTGVDWKDGQVELSGSDILAWLDRRVPHEDQEFTDTDLSLVATWLIDDGFLPDDPGHEVRVVAPSGVRGERAYTEDEGQVGDHLRDLAKTGLDYTAVGSTILLLPEDFTASVGLLTDADFPEGLAISEDGSSLVTRQIVWGKDSTIKGEAGGRDPFYGLLEVSSEETSILDDASAQAAARSRLRASLPVPLWLDSDEVTLSPDAAVDVAQLVPGWCVDVQSSTTCRPLARRMKIAGLSVKDSSSGEQVQVKLAPTGEA